MQEFDANWARWCHKAIVANFKRIKDENVGFFLEGERRDTKYQENYVELRIDGPNITQNAKEQWRLFFEVNVLIVVKIGGPLFRITEITGIISSMFTDLCVDKKGDKACDDGSYLGCLSLVYGQREKIQVSNFGKIRPDTDILQSTVEGHYEFFVD